MAAPLYSLLPNRATLGRQKVFWNLPHHAHDPRFSPEGGRLAYWAKIGDGGEILIANLHGEEILRINTPGVDRHPAWIRLWR
jgi:Tol biopolymer transport system component